MSNYLNEDLIIDPHYRTMCVTLQANNNLARNRGSLICKKGLVATLSGSPASACAISDGDDGTLDIYGTSGYTEPFGVLLEDVPKDTSAHSVQVLVSGEVRASALYKDDTSVSHALAHMAYEDYSTDPDGEDNIILRRCAGVGIYAK